MNPDPTLRVESPNRCAEKAQSFLAFASPLRRLIDRGWVTADESVGCWEIDADTFERLSSGEQKLWHLLDMLGTLARDLPHLDPQARRAVQASLQLLFADVATDDEDDSDVLADVVAVPLLSNETLAGGVA